VSMDCQAWIGVNGLSGLNWCQWIVRLELVSMDCQAWIGVNGLPALKGWKGLLIVKIHCEKSNTQKPMQCWQRPYSRQTCFKVIQYSKLHIMPEMWLLLHQTRKEKKKTDQ
jgi:hypothetical protein